MNQPAPETVADRLDDLAQRAEADIRNPHLVGILVDMIAVMREIDATRAGTGITAEQLAQAVGGAEFLGSLGAMLDRLDHARREDVERVIEHLFAGRPPAPARAPRNGAPARHP